MKVLRFALRNPNVYVPLRMSYQDDKCFLRHK
nr:MAG TPA: hypothetical protein [Caudoviricetes sp.]